MMLTAGKCEGEGFVVLMIYSRIYAYELRYYARTFFSSHLCIHDLEILTLKMISIVFLCPVCRIRQGAKRESSCVCR